MANYLYNGVELPELPEWDRKAYPYAAIGKHILSSNYVLRMFSEPYEVSSTSFSSYSLYRVPEGKTFLSASCSTSSPTLWSEVKENTAGSSVYTGNSVVWNTFDIVCGDTVVQAKTGDLPVTAFVYDKKSFLQGLAAGLCGRGIGVREPVAYLYNGVRLPKIPDEVMAYPYVVMHYLNTIGANTILVYGYDTKPVASKGENPITGATYDRIYLDSGTYIAGNWYSTLPDEWAITEVENVTDAALGYHSCRHDLIIWANFDVYTTDGTLYLAKSEPVPVYE